MIYCKTCNVEHPDTLDHWTGPNQYGSRQCREYCKQRVKKWRQRNYEYYRTYNREYRKKHAKPKRIAQTPQEVNQKKIAKRREKLKTDLGFRVLYNLRKRLRKALRAQRTNKQNTFIQLLGCSNEQLKTHLESKFQPGMNWSNYGQWHIDHIKPLSRFDLTRTEEVQQATHYSNLQPLWARDNIVKGIRESWQSK